MVLNYIAKRYSHMSSVDGLFAEILVTKLNVTFSTILFVRPSVHSNAPYTSNNEILGALPAQF